MRESGIPAVEQDHDAGRIRPEDGQAVVDYLNQRNASPDDIGTFDFTSSEDVVREAAAREPASYPWSYPRTQQ